MMSKWVSRRSFVKQTAIAGIRIAGATYFDGSFASALPKSADGLYTLSGKLLQEWAAALLQLQVTDKSQTLNYGGILSPANNTVHGRMGDTIYPFLHLAHKQKQDKYLDAAVLLYHWMETHVSQSDGSWLNEPKAGSWKGTTVFTSIALAETLKHHSSVMDLAWKRAIEARLQKAGEFIFQNFKIEYGNINYPITASYALSLLGIILDVAKFRSRGKELAHEGLKFFSKNNAFLHGEGDPYYVPSKKGCFSVDLGYNVEESLPALVQYGLLTNDEKVLETVTRSMQTHMEFMLPDGGWDNSWGTRNYKWTYWGSRTSDGCQPAFALMADRDPRFYKVALQNTKLLKSCTTNGLLYGGLHVAAHGLLPSSHHTFCHIKALTTILDSEKQLVPDIGTLMLPREKIYGSRFFEDIQTWLIAKGKYRATVTGYDREYKKTQNGHPSGGALTMLWHQATGPLLSGSMNQYQLFEADNMQADTDPLSMPLTPRIQFQEDGKTYMNISDLTACMEAAVEQNGWIKVNTWSKLVDKDQQSPASGEVNCKVSYHFGDQKVRFVFETDAKTNTKIQVIFPVVSKSREEFKLAGDRALWVYKEHAKVKITANQPFTFLPTTTKSRIFNAVPGLEAIPISILMSKQVVIELEVA